MKLVKLTYHDRQGEWGFEDFVFHRDVTLIVGASGVGKTRVLKAIACLRQIATDTLQFHPWGIDWAATFTDDEGREYFWSGAFGLRPVNGDEEDESEVGTGGLAPAKPRIDREQLLSNGKEVFSRSGDNFSIRERRVDVKLSAHESGLSLLDEDAVLAAKGAVSQMLLVDSHDERSGEISRGRIRRTAMHILLQRYTDLEQIRASHLSTHTKLAIISVKFVEEFREIVARFVSVFTFVEDVRFELDPLSDSARLKIRERGGSQYIDQQELSAGMLRSIMQIARLALWPSGTLILIDEFENSLGPNCLDILTSDVTTEGARLQFIITSHHPYIISNIQTNRWKILGRRKGVLKSFTADELKLGKSHHDSHGQLLNNPVFKTGILPQ